MSEHEIIVPRFARSGGRPSACFTTRQTGQSGDFADEGKLRRFCRQRGSEPYEVALANQVHGTQVQTVTQGGTYPETDGFVTRVPGLYLCIRVADCAALLLWDPEAGVAAAAHAGWRGAAGGIVDETLNAMEREGAAASRIRTFVSPCISAGRYEVGEEVAGQFPDEFVYRKDYAKPHVDLRAFLRRQLADAGVRTGRIEIHPGCTWNDPEYHSYRRDGESAGRMAALISP